jgi:hypothetical protein
MIVASLLRGSDGRLACKAVYGFRRRSSPELDAVGARRRLGLDCSFGVVKPVGRLSWRPLLSVLCRRIYYTAVDRFCAPVAPAAQLKDIRCHCMPDIFSQSNSLAVDSRTAFSLRPFKKEDRQPEYDRPTAFRLGPGNVRCLQPSRSLRPRNKSRSLILIPALRVNSSR